MLCCRQQAEASDDAVQAGSTSAAPAAARRTTADMATQCVLGDLDSEPFTAHTHESHKAQAESSGWGPTENSSVESTGLSGTGPAAQIRHASHALIQAQDHPTRGTDRHPWRDESGMLTKHPLQGVHYSDLEGLVTEDEAALQAEATAHSGSEHRLHAAPWGHQAGPVQERQQAAMPGRPKQGISLDEVSISVTAGGYESAPNEPPASWSVTSQGRASSRHAGPGGPGGPRGMTAAGGQSPYAIRSPLQSVHEELGIRTNSRQASSTGPPHLD